MLHSAPQSPIQSSLAFSLFRPQKNNGLYESKSQSYRGALLYPTESKKKCPQSIAIIII